MYTERVLFCYVFTLQENDRLRNDLITLERSVTERIGYLERHKVQRSNSSIL